VRGFAALKAVTLVVVVIVVVVEVPPVIIGATGTILKAFRKYLSNTPGKHSINGLQKSAMFGTAHTPRKVTM
jgi:RNase P/RNase MRP subunit POP5